MHPSLPVYLLLMRARGHLHKLDHVPFRNDEWRECVCRSLYEDPSLETTTANAY